MMFSFFLSSGESQPSHYNFSYESKSIANEDMTKTSDKFFSLLCILLVPRIIGTKFSFSVCNSFAKDGKIPYAATAIAASIFSLFLIFLVVLTSKFIDFLCSKYIESDGTGFAVFNRIFICIPVITALVSGIVVLTKSFLVKQKIEDWNGEYTPELLSDFKQYYCTRSQQWFIFAVLCILVTFLMYCLTTIVNSRVLNDMSAKNISLGKYMKIALYALAALAILALLCLGILALAGALKGLLKNSLLTKLLGALALVLAACLLGAIFGKALAKLLGSLMSALKALGKFLQSMFSKMPSSRKSKGQSV